MVRNAPRQVKARKKPAPRKPLPFSGRDRNYLFRMAVATVLSTVLLFIVAHYFNNLANKINSTYSMTYSILDSTTANSHAIGLLIDTQSGTVDAIEKLSNSRNDVNVEIKSLQESVGKLKTQVQKRKKQNPRKFNSNYPIIEPIENGHR